MTPEHAPIAADECTTLLATYPLPEFAGQRVFLTGATGFVGYWLLSAFAALNAQGTPCSVCALSRQPENFLKRHPRFANASWLTWVRGDIQRYQWPEKPFDLMLHAATDTSPQAAAQSLQLYDDIVLGSRHLARHALHCGARRVLFVSSGAIYGEQPGTLEKLPEDFPGSLTPLATHSAYALGKRAMESMAVALAESSSLETVIARCFAFSGTGLPAHLALAQFISAARNESAIILQGDGQAVRSYLYAADMAIWLLALLVRGANRQAYNVGSPHGQALHQIAREVGLHASPPRPIRILGSTTGTPRARYVPDTGFIESSLGVKAWTSLSEGIRRMLLCPSVPPAQTAPLS